MMNVRKALFEKQDLKYRDFHKKLVPNIDEERIIGVRVPELRKIGKSLSDNDFDGYYYEEKMLHGFYIGYSKISFEEKLKLLDEFVPQIDNWAVCDCTVSTLKFIAKNREKFLEYLKKYMMSAAEYELRFAVVVLMSYYLTDDYIDYCIDYFVSVKSDDYYVKMAVAWALSKAFVTYESVVLPVLEKHLLDSVTEKMTIKKIKDSYCVSKETKQYLSNR